LPFFSSQLYLQVTKPPNKVIGKSYGYVRAHAAQIDGCVLVAIPLWASELFVVICEHVVFQYLAVVNSQENKVNK
jgi:hypothetical protein